MEACDNAYMSTTNSIDTHSSNGQDGDKKDGLFSALAKIDKTVTGQREKIESDPDSFSDKLIKWALPAIAGFVVSKGIAIAWDAIFHRGRFAKKQDPSDISDSPEDNTDMPTGEEASQGVLLGMLFAAITGVLGALTSTLSTKGSEKLVARRQDKRSR